ncbi:sodium-dependent transporter [bacterium]|nr:sodium-dependent transporter [bacterium]
MAQPRGQWSGRLGFILAAAGSAVGLGNLWKFPYITYENQGGAFVLVYIAAIALVGLPIMFAEIILGRRSQLSPVGAFRKLAAGRPGGSGWCAVGYLGVAAGFIILSYYSVVAGWTLRYTWMALSGELGRLAAEPGALDTFFGGYVADGGAQLLGNGLFMATTVAAVFFGVKSGIERVATFLMPILMVILLSLAVYAATTPGFGAAISFLFRPNFGELTSHGLLEAVGHAFFTLSLGMGAIVTYGSYMGKETSIPVSGLAIAALDTIIAILACIVMFSIIFTFDLDVTKSAGILFTTLPAVFFQLSGGGLLAASFYILVAFAALTSTISLLEVVSSFSIDELGWSRHRATLTMGAAIFLFGILNALSLGANDALTSLNVFGDTHLGVFNNLDYLASNWLLPVGGLLIAIFTGWILSPRDTLAEMETGHPGSRSWFPGWLALIRFVSPLAVGAIIFSIIFLGMEYQ